MNRILRIAMLSVHSSPLGPLGTADTGGMSVYLLELSSELGKRGHRVDIFTRQTEKEYRADNRVRTKCPDHQPCCSGDSKVVSSSSLCTPASVLQGN